MFTPRSQLSLEKLLWSCSCLLIYTPTIRKPHESYLLPSNHAQQPLTAGSGRRVPFEAKSVDELRVKVLACRWRPIPPEKYSADLLQVLPKVRQLADRVQPIVPAYLSASSDCSGLPCLRQKTCGVMSLQHTCTYTVPEHVSNNAVC